MDEFTEYRASEFSHYINNQENPAQVIVFTAYRCKRCGQWHRDGEKKLGSLPWGNAIMAGLEKIDMDEVPEFTCDK